MKDGYWAIDCDLHIVEPDDLWLDYIDSRFADRAPRKVATTAIDSFFLVDGRLAPRIPGDALAAVQRYNAELIRDQKRPEMTTGDFEATTVRRAMDAEGLDAAVLFPTSALSVNEHEDLDPDFSHAIAQAYNNWLADFIKSGDPDRMYGCGIVAIQSVDLAADEIERVANLGFKAIVLRPNPPRLGCYFHHREFDKIWRACERLGLAVVFHEGAGSSRLSSGADRFRRGCEYAIWHAAAHPMEQMHAVAAMTLGGVMERFPKLRVGFLEANCSWLPYWLWRLDEHWEFKGYLSPDEVTLPPSEYFKRQGWASVESEETPVGKTIEQIGDSNIVFSTDWPHLDSAYPNSIRDFLSLEISADSKRKILWDNSMRLYNL